MCERQGLLFNAESKLRGTSPASNVESLVITLWKYAIGIDGELNSGPRAYQQRAGLTTMRQQTTTDSTIT